jgi:Epoxide hydrolase N terminus
MNAVTQQVQDPAAIRPFRVSFPEAEVADMVRRVKATKWPEREPVADASQGVQLAAIQKLARYWVTEYDWRPCEARLSALPNFITEIDGLDIHFIHVRSKHDNALPLIVTHGWPGSADASLLPPDGRHPPRCRERLSRRALPGPAELDGAGVSQSDPLQQAGEGRPLCGLGTAEALDGRASHWLQLTAQLVQPARQTARPEPI